MKKINHRKNWLEIGYELFGNEGDEEIQVERLARILGLNKSGFYHYFGTKENYMEDLMDHHLNIADIIKLEIKEAKSFDPDCLMLMVKHRTFFLVQMQLFLIKNTALFTDTFHIAATKYIEDILPLWSEYLGIQNSPELSIRYYNLTRSMFFTQVTPKSLTYDHLQNLAREAKSLAHMMVKENKTFSTNLIKT